MGKYALDRGHSVVYSILISCVSEKNLMLLFGAD
jgi:hypothetical protein